jgi:DNA-binding transcriptional MerR regulator/methylmalonyl-CoA mutase cobalamin-binding subunit
VTRRSSGAPYPIRAVAKLTGLSIDTIRAWERRYQAVTPARDDRGRVYTEADVARLALLQQAVARGHAIGRAVALSNADLRRIVESERPTAPAPRSAPPAIDTAHLVAALERMDGAAAEAELGRLAALLPPIELIRDIVMPVLAAIGEKWHDSPAGIAQEHLASGIVRNVLGSLMRSYGRRTAPARMVFATPSGERHEFGALGAAALAASGGLAVIYLGPDLPADAIVEGATSVEADVVVCGILAGADAATRAEAAALARMLPRDVELWFGGSGAKDAAAAAGARVVALDGFDALEQHLTRLGGRF